MAKKATRKKATRKKKVVKKFTKLDTITINRLKVLNEDENTLTEQLRLLRQERDSLERPLESQIFRIVDEFDNYVRINKTFGDSSSPIKIHATIEIRNYFDLEDNLNNVLTGTSTIDQETENLFVDDFEITDIDINVEMLNNKIKDPIIKSALEIIRDDDNWLLNDMIRDELYGNADLNEEVATIFKSRFKDICKKYIV